MAEVILLRPVHGETNILLALQVLMVEMGVDFAFDDKCQLPDRLPASLDGVKLIVIDEKSWADYHAGETGAALETFRKKGGLVFRFETPEPWNVYTEETLVRSPFEMMAASAGLTLDHPQLRRRLQSRSFRELVQSLRSYLLAQMEGYRKRPLDTVWGEPHAFGVLQTLELLCDYEPQFGWGKHLDEHLEFLVTQRQCEPANLDYVPAMETFLRAYQRTRDERYLEFARQRLAYVLDRFDRIEGVPVLQPGRDHLLWTECIAMLAPSAALLTEITGEERFLAAALKAAHAVHELCCDPKTGLWYHGGRRGWHTPAFWGRGQAWAVIGLTGLARHLPESHPERGVIIEYLRRIFEALVPLQDAEGMWHNVLDHPESRSELRCTSMFVWCFSEARRKGWIVDERLDAMLRRGFRALKGRVWRDKVASVVTGTGASVTMQFYLSRPHIFYGASDVLHAGLEYVKTLGE